MVKVPRFFETVTKFWTTEPQDDALLSTTNGQKTAATTVGTLDVEVSRDRFRNEPELIVGPDGPMVFGPLDYRYRSTLDWEKRLDAALHSLLQMPSTNASHHGLVPILRQEFNVHYNGWVFGHEVDRLMDSLTHPFGYSQPEVMIPMEIISDESVELPMWRSGWALVHPDPSVPIWSPDEQDFLTITWPTAVLRDLLGRALLGKGHTESAGVARKHVVEIDGQWYAAVPRFFRHRRRPLVAHHRIRSSGPGHHLRPRGRNDDRGRYGPRREFQVGGPSLIVGPEGPVYHDISWGFGDKEDSIARRRAVTEVLMTLPGDTPVTAIDFHT